MATLFSLDDASSSRMMSMSDRQSQLVLQRRKIIRQQSQSHVNSNLLMNGSLQDVIASNCGSSSVSSPTHHPVATHNTGDSIADHSTFKLSESCTSTAVKHTCEVKNFEVLTPDEPKSTESCDENSNHDAEKENRRQLISLNASWRGRKRNSS